MHFKIVYGNHYNYGIQVSETILLVKAALEVAGHAADIVRHFCPGFINIFQEGLITQDNSNIDFLNSFDAALKHPKTHIIIIATEYLKNHTFNDFDANNEKDTSIYSNKAYWRTRLANFLYMEKASIATWHLGEYAVDDYKNYLKHNKIFYLPHYYAPNLTRVNHNQDTDKDIDFLFTGSQTDYRKGIITDLRNRGYNVVLGTTITASFHRENLLQRTKVSLNLKQYPDWPYASPSRFHYHIINKSLLLTENCTYGCDIQPYVITAPEDNFLEFCVDTLEAQNYNKKAQEYFELFRKECDFKPVIEKLLDLSFEK